MPERTRYEEGTPCWVDLSSTDPGAAKAYYTALFGWEFDDMPTPDGGTYSMATLRGGFVAAIGGQPPGTPAGAPSIWNTYLATDDADAATAKVAPAGGELIMGPVDIGQSGRMAFLTDPTGAVAGLWQAGEHIGATLVNEPGAVIWNELITPDPDKALAFYQAVVGLSSSTSDLPGGPYTVLKVREAQVGGCTTPRMPQVPTHWHVYFAVEDTDATAAKSTASGGGVMVEPFDVPAVGRMTVLRDPTGAAFSVMTGESA